MIKIIMTTLKKGVPLIVQLNLSKKTSWQACFDFLL